jgi:hypothetical protein
MLCALAFDLKPLRALGRLREGVKREVDAVISSGVGCCGSIY